MEEEAVLGEMLAMAQATRRAGGIVIVQVKRMAQRGTLPPKQVKIPGILVDFVVVDREQRQTYATYYDPSYSGELRIPNDDITSVPFGPRKVIVRRAAMELFPGAICNLGAGVSTGTVDDRRRGGVARRRHSHQRTGHHRGRADHRTRFRRRTELRGDDRATGAVRLLRRRRSRPRVPVLCRSRRGRQCERQPFRRPDHRRGRFHQHQPRTRSAWSSAAP